MLKAISIEALQTVSGGKTRGCVIRRPRADELGPDDRPRSKCKPGNTGITGGMNVTNNDVPGSRC